MVDIYKNLHFMINWFKIYYFIFIRTSNASLHKNNCYHKCPQKSENIWPRSGLLLTKIIFYNYQLQIKINQINLDFFIKLSKIYKIIFIMDPRSI